MLGVAGAQAEVAQVANSLGGQVRGVTEGCRSRVLKVSGAEAEVAQVA